MGNSLAVPGLWGLVGLFPSLGDWRLSRFRDGVTEGYCVPSFCEHQPVPSCLLAVWRRPVSCLSPDPHSDKDLCSADSPRGSLMTSQSLGMDQGSPRPARRSPHQIWGSHPASETLPGPCCTPGSKSMLSRLEPLQGRCTKDLFLCAIFS